MSPTLSRLRGIPAWQHGLAAFCPAQLDIPCMQTIYRSDTRTWLVIPIFLDRQMTVWARFISGNRSPWEGSMFGSQMNTVSTYKPFRLGRMVKLRCSGGMVKQRCRWGRVRLGNLGKRLPIFTFNYENTNFIIIIIIIIKERKPRFQLSKHWAYDAT